jgi:hypothetical protein
LVALSVPVKSALQQFVVPVRLHTGNFDFRSARPDGADLRFVAADGKTALVHRLESFDPTNELAVAWVQLPTLAPGAKDSAIYVLSGNPKAEAPSTAPLHDARTQLALHFGAQLRNEAGDGVTVEAPGAVPEPLGLAGVGIGLSMSTANEIRARLTGDDPAELDQLAGPAPARTMPAGAAPDNRNGYRSGSNASGRPTPGQCARHMADRAWV